MKIIYFSIGHIAAGVRKKLIDKTAVLRSEGIDADLCLVATGDTTEKGVQNILVDQKWATRVGRWPLLWRLSVFIEQANIYRSINKYLRQHAFDLILFRYPVADYFFWRLVSRYPRKIVFEHNSIEERELLLRQKDSFYFKYFYWGERIFGARARARAAGLVGVTPEITQWQIKKTPHTPAETITNGIDVERVPPRAGVAFDGKQLNLLLLAGSPAPWHGVDLLLNALQSYQGPTRVTCVIAGNILADLATKAAQMDDVVLLPSQSGKDLDDWINKSHIGIGSLGIDSSFLTQASTLKVREYWSRGLPFVLRYDDADLIENEGMRPFYLRLSPDKSVDIGEIISFAGRVYARPNPSAEMRALALKQISYSVKSKSYLHFFNRLIK